MPGPGQARCLLPITGPGLMNAATPIGEAYSDLVPILVLCSVNAKATWAKAAAGCNEITDQRAAIAPLTGFARTVMDTKDLPQAMADAYALFETARPRPVVLEFPDVLSAPANSGQARRVKATRPKAKPEDLKAAATLIDGARKLVVIAGRRGGLRGDCPTLRGEDRRALRHDHGRQGRGAGWTPGEPWRHVADQAKPSLYRRGRRRCRSWHRNVGNR